MTELTDDETCIEEVSERLLVERDEAETLVRVLKYDETNCNDEIADLSLLQFLSCFETEGELNAREAESRSTVVVSLRKKTSPRLLLSLTKKIFRLCFLPEEESLDSLTESGIICVEIFELLLTTSLSHMERTVEHLEKIEKIMKQLVQFQTISNPSSSRLVLQDLCRRKLTQCDMVTYPILKSIQSFYLNIAVGRGVPLGFLLEKCGFHKRPTVLRCLH